MNGIIITLFALVGFTQLVSNAVARQITDITNGSSPNVTVVGTNDIGGSVVNGSSNRVTSGQFTGSITVTGGQVQIGNSNIMNVTNVFVVTNGADTYNVTVTISDQVERLQTNGLYLTEAVVRLKSPFPVGMLKVYAYGPYLAGGVNALPTKEVGTDSVTSGRSDLFKIIDGKKVKIADGSYIGINNAYGEYRAAVLSSNSEPVLLMTKVE